jgi:hypothetical protein
VSSDSVRAGFLNGNESTGLIDSEIKIASSGNGNGKSCESCDVKETHTERFKEWLDSAAKQKSTL